jgi:hypothetical protein
VLKNTRQETMLGFQITIPNFEPDLLVHVAHILFSNSFMRFDEFYYMKYLLTKITNLDLAIDEAEKYGWRKAFIKFVDNIKDKELTFPYFVPFRFLFHTYMLKIVHDIKNNSFSFSHLKSYSKFILLAIFWRIRYRFTKILPFEVEINAT